MDVRVPRWLAATASGPSLAYLRNARMSADASKNLVTRCSTVAAGTVDVLMARLREGRANTARGAAHFLRETVGRVRYGGASGQLTMRADSGFYTHAVVSACRKMDRPGGETLELEADHRRHAIENAIRDLKSAWGSTISPRRFPANGAWLAVQVIAHNLARWTARIGLGEQLVTTKTLRLLLPGRTAHPLGAPPHFASAQRWPWEAQFSLSVGKSAPYRKAFSPARPIRYV